MKRTVFLSTFAALSLASALPAMAQNRGPYGKRIVKPTFGIAKSEVKSYAPHAGAPGTTVVVHGYNFAAGTQVALGGNLITPSLLTPNRIQFQIPSGADDGTLELVLPNRRRSSLTVGAFDVQVPHIRPPVYGYGSGKGTYGSANVNVGFNLYEAQWAKTRNSRRNGSRALLMSRWNRGFLRTPAAKAELELHAKRTAQLQRMARIAKARGNARLTVRINKAMKREDRRHDRKMTSLKAAFVG